MKYEGEATITTVEDTVKLLAECESLIIVPGYGLAVAKGQYPLKEMVDSLLKAGKKVSTNYIRASLKSFLLLFCSDTKGIC
jgi:NAD(P) transhydrogenase